MKSTSRQHYEVRLQGLQSERNNYETMWGNIDKFVMPGVLRTNVRADKGVDKMANILDETAILDGYRVFVAGMQSGLTSQARPWFRLAPKDHKLRDISSVKSYLYEAENRMRQIMAGSNIYGVMGGSYGDAGLFGHGAYLLVEDEIDIIRAIPAMMGQHWIAQDHRMVVDTLYRQIGMTIKQIVGRFVKQTGGDLDWSRVSNTVKSMWDQSNYNEVIPVTHCVEPRADRDIRKMDKANKRWASCYFENDNNSEVALEESGFDHNPIIAPRWNTVGDDVYGSMHPGELTLPAVKALQHKEETKALAIDKKADPPLVASTDMRNYPSSTLPGSITYAAMVGTQPPIRAIAEVNLDISHLREDMEEVRQRIRAGWYQPLFMAISQMEGVQPRNVFELTSRKEEQLLQLGPMIERQYREHLAPVIDTIFRIMLSRELLPEAPRELEGQELDIEYISILAQAQRAVATGAIERTMNFVGSLAAIRPDIVDKVDFDQAVDEYADMVGAPPTMIRSDDDVKNDREARQQQQETAANNEAMATMAPALQQGAQAAKLMAEAGMTPGDSNIVSPQEKLASLGIG